MIRLVLSDIDGTLLPFSTHRVSERTFAAIQALEAAGIRFAPASGRPRYDAGVALEERLDLRRAGVFSGGNVVYLDGRAIVERPFDVALLSHMARVVDERELGLFAVCYATQGDLDGETLWGLVAPGPAADPARAMIEAGDFRTRVVGAVPEAAVCNAEVFCNAPEDVPHAAEVLRSECPGLDVLQSAPTCLDVRTKGWDKVHGLEALTAAMGATKDEVLFFGDSENDMSLFEALPNTCCVAGGGEVALAAARWRIPAAEDDGPARLMEALAASGGDLNAAMATLA